MSSTEKPISTPYAAPNKGFLSLLPPSWVPYAELMRAFPPVGTMLTYFPSLFGSLLAACMSRPVIDLKSLFVTNAVLLPAAFMLHAAGCSWNDIVDADLDRQVARTRSRPMARGAISPTNASIFTAAETSIWLAMLWQLSPQCVLWATPLVGLVGLYPYAKRFTNYPQVLLGITLAWGTLIACVALGMDPLEIALQGSLREATALACVFMYYVFWMVMIDMIYAHQDLQDDIKAGIFSMAVRYRDSPKLVLSVVGAIQICLLIAVGPSMGFGARYMSSVGIGGSFVLSWLISSIDLNDTTQCWWWFRHGSLMMGSIIATSLFAEYMNRVGGW